MTSKMQKKRATSLCRTSSPNILKNETKKCLKPLSMVGATGFEPTTSSTPRKRATKLRYAPTVHARGRLNQGFPLRYEKYYSTFCVLRKHERIRRRM